MSHIKVRTDNIEIPYIDKIYITKDETSYISLNSGQIVYYENNEKKGYQFNMGKKPFKMLEYLIDNNGNFVKSETLYYDIFGLVESENQDSVVDQVRKDLWKISCIKNSDMKIKKHSFGENALSGYTLTLPEQKVNPRQKYVDDVASRLWSNRPFYLDSEMIPKLFYQNGGQEPDYNTDLDTYMVIQLAKTAYNEGDNVDIKLLEKVPKDRLVSIKDTFLLSDLYAAGKQMKDFKNPMELLNLDEEKITFIFENINDNIRIQMMLSGAKTFFPLRHLIPVIFNTDRKFKFRVLGFVDRLNKPLEYSIKPICITYL